jgi:hypothetical protein
LGSIHWLASTSRNHPCRKVRNVVCAAKKQAGAVNALVPRALMTTNTQIQVVPAIFNGTITKLEKRIAASWGQLERAVQSKDITATRAAVDRLSHLEILRQKHVALEQRIVETISTGSSTQNAPISETISNDSSSATAPVLERDSINLSIQSAPVSEDPNRLSSQAAPALESVFTGTINQIAPVLESLSNGLLNQSEPVPQSSNGSSIQPAPVPENNSNGFSTQTAPVPTQPSPVPEKAADVPQPEVQSPVARPKKKAVRPVEIKFGSVKKHIRYATEIPVTIANWLIEQGKELPITANFIHPSDAGFSQSATTKKLKSGQFMRVGHNQEALLHKARELLDSSGYEGVQIKVLLDNGITLSA